MKFALSLLLLLTGPAFALEFSGYAKTYPILQSPVGGQEDQKIWQNMAKVQIGHVLAYNIRFEGSYELITSTQKHFLTASPQSAYRYDDLNYYLHDPTDPENYKTSLAQNLNRFNFSTSLPFADVILGRQLITFGASKSLAPTDVLTPFAINTIDKEERSGVDALVLRVPVGDLSSVEVGIVAGEEFKSENSAYYVRPKMNIDQFDISALVMNFRERNLLGFDIQHPISDAGFWFEAAYVDSEDERLKNFVRITTGSDYKFQNSLYLALEYHYNGASLGDRFVYPESFIYVRNYHYFIPTLSYEFTPLLTGSIQTYVNAHDGSLFATPKLEYNWTDNLYAAVGVYAGLGNENTSEFGRYGQTYFSSLRYYY